VICIITPAVKPPVYIDRPISRLTGEHPYTYYIGSASFITAWT
jgi:hypothetical protein